MENVDFLIVVQDPASRILIIEDENYPLYSRVKIPFYVKGERAREDIFLRDFKHYSDKNIEYLCGKKVVSLDPKNQFVKTEDGTGFHYGKLLLTTGGVPKKLNKYKNEHSLQTIEDADKVVEDVKKAKKGVIIGSGFIALEFVDIFSHYGLETHLCVSKEGFWANFLQKEVSDLICKLLKERGVKIYYGEDSPFVTDEDTIVGTGIGLDLSKSFFEGAGLNFDAGLVVDQTLKTDFDNVYASGDLAKFFSKKLDRYVRYGNWTNAAVSGKYAGFNMLSKNEVFDNLSAYSITHDKLSIVFLGFAGLDGSTEVKTKVISDRECIQYFIRRGKLDGCILVNRPQDRQNLQNVIESREEFAL